MPKINEILLKWEGFQYATSLDINMGYYKSNLVKMQVIYVQSFYRGAILLQTSTNGSC